LEANLTAVRRFPDVFWLPGFWAEFGMISNPPSFGARCVWPQDGFPTCKTVLRGYDDVPLLKVPDVQTDGLLPLIITRLEQCQPAIEASGHRIRFATSHGPLTIASYVLGHTELFLGMRERPEIIHVLLSVVTRFVVDWLAHQKAKFPSIEGVLVLEDLMGFVGESDFCLFVLPYMTDVFATLDVPVRLLHNDANGRITARYLNAMNVNLFNFSFEHHLHDIRALAGDNVTLLGNIPPRDVLADGTTNDVQRQVTNLVESISDPRRIIVSAGGFTPGQFNEEKIQAFCDACKESFG
jgi:uroporphyrinogen decarboxylase